MRYIKDFVLFLMDFKKMLLTVVYIIISNLKYRSPRLKINWTWRFSGYPRISASSKAKIVIGNNFIAHSKINANSLGVIQPVVINAQGKGSEIIIGENTGVSGCTITAYKKIEIGDNVLIGSGALIMDSDAHQTQSSQQEPGAIPSSPICVEDNVFIGARAIILKGVRIGKGSVVGAGSIVTKSFPGNSIIAGNPAKIIGSTTNG